MRGVLKVRRKKILDEKHIKDSLRKRKVYAEIKNDPIRYKIRKENDRLKYLKRKEQKKIKSIAEMTPSQKRMQRKKWRENTRRFVEKKKKERTDRSSSPLNKEEEGVHLIIGAP
ncbi:hypothetical protein O3G_MSEX001933 [Manduca sexta]|uniref:Uncharacterized protein n=1 Tax=Manduca sexta TaxID=7130 RepID=A0A921YMC8_MANSE|nr:hypothetical protein O3G_MSEX001933 [Manduca sexta]